MPITPNNPFKGRQHPGEVIILCVRWYLRYPISVAQMSEMTTERGLAISASCIWRWVQIYGPEVQALSATPHHAWQSAEDGDDQEGESEVSSEGE
jgi:transposase-like protein